MSRIKDEVVYEWTIDKSRFICYLNRAFTEQEARDYIQQIKKLHPNATHVCSAFIMGEHNELHRSSDDGEPSGTAGVPMLESLKMNEMNDVVAAVVRYYGGIKLGAGGLIRAYSKSVSEALKTAAHTQLCLCQNYTITFTYDLIGKIEYFLNEHQVSIINKEYELEVVYQIRSDNFNLAQELLELCNGKIKVDINDQQVIEIDL